MITLRKSEARGHANHGWLESYHSFSFAEYYDPAHMHYSVLRVINDDKVAGGAGFGMHPHRDMEIVTYMLAGELRHQDSMGNGSVIRAGDVQRMTAGTGVRHSEVNASTETTAHLLQIWILPEANNLTPSYEEKHFNAEQKLNRWCLVVSPNGHDGSIKINQQIWMYAANLAQDKTLAFTVDQHRCAYLHVATGRVLVNGQTLVAGDALMIEDVEAFEVQAIEGAELVLFDLPKQPYLNS